MANFDESPLGGILSARTGSVYRLDPTGTVPVEPLLDLRPSFSADRVALDMVDAEDESHSYLVTTNPLQDFQSAQSNVHRDLKRLNLSGTLIGGIDLPFIGTVGLTGLPGFGGGLRADLLKWKNLVSIADRREPVMVVTPRGSLPRAFIENLQRTWSPELGENSLVSVSFVEARIISPLAPGELFPDVAALNTGNVSTTAQGGQAAPVVQTQTVTPPQAFGAAPNVVPII